MNAFQGFGLPGQDVETLVRNYRPGGAAAARILHQPGGLRCRHERVFGALVAVRRAFLPDPQPRRLLHLADRQRPDHRRARRRRRNPRLPQHLPPSRLAHLHRGIRPRQQARLPVSPLDLRPRRQADDRTRRRDFGVDRSHARPASRARAQRRRPDLHLARRRSAQLRRGVPRDLAPRSSRTAWSAPRSRTRSTIW